MARSLMTAQDKAASIIESAAHVLYQSIYDSHTPAHSTGQCLSVTEYATAYKLRIFIFIPVMFFLVFFLWFTFYTRPLSNEMFWHFFNATIFGSFRLVLLLHFHISTFLHSYSANSAAPKNVSLNCFNCVLLLFYFFLFLCFSLLPLTQFALASFLVSVICLVPAKFACFPLH